MTSNAFVVQRRNVDLSKEATDLSTVEVDGFEIKEWS